MDKTHIKYLFMIFLVICAIGIINSCKSDSISYPVERVIYVPVKDTISEKDNITRIVNLEHRLKLTQDSLKLIKDSLGEDLFVANYKLARIKYYNQIAAKGNNIKYLRGWINRVINEK